MLLHILQRANLMLRRNFIWVLFVTLTVSVLLGYFILLRYQPQPMDCSKQVASLVAGNFENLQQSHHCFSDDSRFGKMTDEEFDQFAHQASPQQPQQISLIGHLQGTDDTHPRYHIDTYAVHDGYTETIITIYVSDSNKVERVKLS